MPGVAEFYGALWDLRILHTLPSKCEDSTKNDFNMLLKARNPIFNKQKRV